MSSQHQLDAAKDAHHLGFVPVARGMPQEKDADECGVEGPEHEAPFLPRIESGDQQRRGEIAGAVAPDIRILELMREDEIQESCSTQEYREDGGDKSKTADGQGLRRLPQVTACIGQN